ncbi:MAG TPA: LLM class flavin-dependent oxidoreductase [Actinomycetota bacterium]|nr:LLM class flavin-dependent oxidoreductase [Actinomycetota bacterium]
MRFGYFLTPVAEDYGELARQARLAEDLGLDLLGIQDHPYQRRFFDTWTLLSALGVETRRIRLFPDVANLPLRQPAVLAKSAASLDLITGGRVELGLGAGAFWEAIEAMGGPARSPGEAVDALEEAIAVIRLMWSGERAARFDGRFHSLGGVHPGPEPAHPIGIWLGAGGPRMLELTGRLADGWVPSSSWATPDRLGEMHRRIDEGVAAAGRDRGAVLRVYNVFGRITDGPSNGFLDGPVDRWVDELTELATTYRMDAFVAAFEGPLDASLVSFAEKIVPAVREGVAGERAGAGR